MSGDTNGVNNALTVYEPPERALTSGDAATVVTEIMAPSAQVIERNGIVMHEGYRFLCLGETGSGKTTLEKVVVYTTIQRGYANFALVQDTKSMFPEFPQSVYVPDVKTFVARGGFRSGEIPVASFRGDPRRDIEVTAEDVAYLSVAMARKGIVRNGIWQPNPHVTVIEEISEAASAGRKHLKSPSVLKLAEQGRKMGVSLVGTTQSPRKIPLDLLGQASSVAFFRLTGADANYLGERLELDPALIAAVRGPNNEGLPNYKFAIYVKGKPWDGLIHQLDKRTATMFD